MLLSWLTQLFTPAPRAPGRDARPPTVEALETRLVPDAAGAAQVVGQLYHDLLQRTPEPGGLAHWSAALDSGLTRAQVALQIQASPEFHDNQVRALYQRFLHRDADPSGLDHWSAALDQGLLTEDAIAALLVGSAEGADLARDDSLIAPLGDGGITPATTGFTTPLLFQGINPIRVVDTRFPATASVYGSPAFAAGETRSYDLIPNVSPNDLPAGVKALVMTVTMVGASGAVNYLTIWPTGATMPPTASLVTDHAGATASSEVITAANATGSIDVFAFLSTHVVIDITGYFIDDLRAGDRLAIAGSYGAGGLVSASNASTANSVFGLLGTLSSTSAGGNSAGVRGISNGTGLSGIGVWGSQDGSGYGVYGSVTGGGIGVHGLAGAGGTGVSGVANGGIGVSGTGSNGVYGFGETGVYGTGTTTGVFGNGALYGVYGITAGTGASGIGVWGEITSTSPGVSSSAVRGMNHGTGAGGIGVWGSQDGTGTGVYGSVSGAGIGVHGAASGNASEGVYGTGNTGVHGSGTLYGVRGDGGSFGGVFSGGAGSTYGVYGVGTSYGVYSSGNFGASGTKAFIDPHPTDPTKEIKYVTLEGPEAGIYYRGKGHFTDGLATVSFPDYFTVEAETKGLSVTITPIGQLAVTAVQTLDTSHAVLLSSADVDFTYTVNGIRAGYADFEPVQANTSYRPRGEDWNIWGSLNAVQKARLVATGIYNADGTVNRDTVHSLGWV